MDCEVNLDNDDSDLFCSSSNITKRKATGSHTSRSFKQAKLSFGETSTKIKFTGNDGVSDNGLSEGKSNRECKNFGLENSSFYSVNESTSAYFKSADPKSNNSCPHCWKLFESDSSCKEHIEQCPRKYKITAQISSDVEEPKKQPSERSTDTEPSKKPKTKKGVSTKKSSKDKEENQYDLAYGIALSKSLLHCNPDTLKQFSEPDESTKSSSATNSNPKKRKNKIVKKSVLKERTNEDRQRIITEKAAVVLLDEDDDQKILNPTNSKKNSTRINRTLAQFQDGMCRLWNLTDNDRKSSWYVEELKAQIAVDETCETVSQEHDTETNPVQNLFKETDLNREILKLNLPRRSIDGDWRKIINSDLFSDSFAESKDGRKFHFHSLILNVRCPKVLSTDYKSIFSKYDHSTALIFLEYLYCGTLNDLKPANVDGLSSLANEFDYHELRDVLNDLRDSLEKVACSENVSNDQSHPSGTGLKGSDVDIIDHYSGNDCNGKGGHPDPDTADLFEDEMVDLTQSSHESAKEPEEDDENESNVEKSYWSFIQAEKRKEEELKREEERENLIISSEMEKIETSMKQRDEMMQQILSEFEDDRDYADPSTVENLRYLNRQESNDSSTRDLDENLMKVKTDDNCIVLSSDSETRGSKPETCDEVEIPAKPDDTFDVPFFDPYEHDFPTFGNFSPVHVGSQSLMAEDVPETRDSDLNETLKPTEDVDRGRDDVVTNITCVTTPLTIRNTSRVGKVTEKKSGRRRRSDLGASRIVRKSLSLSLKSPRVSTAKRKSTKSSRLRGEAEKKEWLEDLTNSLMQEFSKSPMFKSSTPLREREFVEITPLRPQDVEVEEPVTPYPNYSRMGEALLKEHLGKYGLKKSLSKKKAEKILKHIYEELHPYLNQETGKLVRKVATDTPKGRGKRAKGSGTKKARTTTSTGSKPAKKSSGTTAKKTVKVTENRGSGSSGTSDNSLERSSTYDSEGDCDFENVSEILTQPAHDPKDLPSAMSHFLDVYPDFHEKILLYEPILIKDLQLKLKETFKKRFKMEDLMNYLDQKCITFRLNSKEENEKKRKKKMEKTRKRTKKGGDS